MVFITIGALCWFKNLHEFFKVVTKCMKEDGIIVINEQHAFTNMLATSGDDEYVPQRNDNRGDQKNHDQDVQNVEPVFLLGMNHRTLLLPQ